MGEFGNPLPFLLMMAVAMLVYAFTKNTSFLIDALLGIGALVLFVEALVLFWPRNSEDDW